MRRLWRKYRWEIIFGIGLYLLTSIPYLLGYFRENSIWKFSGFVFGVEDGNSYIAKMLSGSKGDWLFFSPYTAYPQKGFLAFLPYIIFGKFAASPGLHTQLVALFHFMRFIGGMMMVIASYDFIAIFVNDEKYRRWGTVLASAGGGLGGAIVFTRLLGINGWMPLEFYSPETFGFLGFFGLPHLAMGRAFLLLGLLSFISSEKPLWLSGLLWIALGMMQPLYVAVGWIILAGFIFILGCIAILRKDFTKNSSFVLYSKRALSTVLISSLIVVPTLISFRNDPYLASWSEQNVILSPPAMDYLLAYGIFIPLYWTGIKKLLRNHTEPAVILILSWILLMPVLAYFPYNLQRRMPEGIWVALVVVAIVGANEVRLKYFSAIKVIFVISLIPATLLIMGGITTVWTPGEPLYRPGTEVEIFQFLQLSAPKNTVILAEYSTANAAPAWAPVRTVLGHGPESINFEILEPEVQSFYEGNITGRKLYDWLKDLHVTYMICSKDKPAACSAIRPYARRVISNKDYELYQLSQ